MRRLIWTTLAILATTLVSLGLAADWDGQLVKSKQATERQARRASAAEEIRITLPTATSKSCTEAVPQGSMRKQTKGPALRLLRPIALEPQETTQNTSHPSTGPTASLEQHVEQVSGSLPVSGPNNFDSDKDAIHSSPRGEERSSGEGANWEQTLPANESNSSRTEPIRSPDPGRAEFLNQIQQRALKTREDEEVEPVPDTLPEIPPNFEPWWHSQAVHPLRKLSQPHPVDVDALVLGALRHSPQVHAISDIPLIRQTAVMEADAAFDSHAFMESKWVDTSEPVGNRTIGGDGIFRFRDHNWTYSAGVRRKTTTGGLLELSQRIGRQNNNADYFEPDNQGSARLSLSFTQPLLNGAGRVYNTSLIVVAEIGASVAKDEFSLQLQDHLLEVTRSYWELYLQRAALLQKRRLHQQAAAILQELESRRDFDALQSQIVRAKAAVASRHAEIIRAEMAIRNAESSIRVLVNDPNLLATQQIELVPFEAPTLKHIDIGMRDSLLTALQYRPDIDMAIKNIRAASIRLDMSKNELLPALNFVMESYFSGLKGDGGIGIALGDQVSEGRPSYSVGLVLDIPLGNRAARAVHERRKLELRQLTNQFNATMESLTAEVEVAVREVKTSYREMQSKYRSMMAAETDVRYSQERWRLLPGDDRAPSFLLEDLLDAQERLAMEEFGFLKAQSTYNLALANLKRTTGTLLQYEEVTLSETCENGLPKLILGKPISSDPAQLPEPPEHDAAPPEIPSPLPN